MNELQAILDAYAQARARGERAALATVVSVAGSAYRRPGARMLITERGQTVGAISGGCLERDVVERAQQTMATGAARVVVYDTRGDEDIVWGLGLGCNGVVRVLLESLHEGSNGARALSFIAELRRARQSGVIVTLIRGPAKQAHGIVQRERAAIRWPEIGARWLFAEHDDKQETDEPDGLCAAAFAPLAELGASISADARRALAAGRAATHVYQTATGPAEIFFDVMPRQRALVVFGAEHDAVPVVQLARTLGWHVTVVDTRARVLTRERFREADEVVLCRAEDVPARVSVTRETAVVVMTHNYLADVELLRTLLASPARYVGLLGPKQRTAKLLAEMQTSAGGDADANSARLHAPIGIDIGAETPAEIALAVVAEIKAVWAGRCAGFLRDRAAPIHDDAPAAHAVLELTIDAPTRANSLGCGSS